MSDAVTARSRIEDLRHRYCWAYDSGDAEALGDMFTVDGIVDLGDWGVFHGTTAIVEGFRDQVAAPGLPRATLHTLSCPVIEIDGHAATGQWYVVVHHQPRDGDTHPVRFVGRYFDTYAETNGRWWFTSVRLEQFWFAGY